MRSTDYILRSMGALGTLLPLDAIKVICSHVELSLPASKTLRRVNTFFYYLDSSRKMVAGKVYFRDSEGRVMIPRSILRSTDCDGEELEGQSRDKLDFKCVDEFLTGRVIVLRNMAHLCSKVFSVDLSPLQPHVRSLQVCPGYGVGGMCRVWVPCRVDRLCQHLLSVLGKGLSHLEFNRSCFTVGYLSTDPLPAVVDKGLLTSLKMDRCSYQGAHGVRDSSLGMMFEALKWGMGADLEKIYLAADPLIFENKDAHQWQNSSLSIILLISTVLLRKSAPIQLKMDLIEDFKVDPLRMDLFVKLNIRDDELIPDDETDFLIVSMKSINRRSVILGDRITIMVSSQYGVFMYPYEVYSFLVGKKMRGAKCFAPLVQAFAPWFLKVSPDGTERWVRSRDRYNKVRVEQVSGICKDAGDKLRAHDEHCRNLRRAGKLNRQLL